MAISYAQAHFGKPLDQITAQDLTEYFSEEHDESLTLEFKSFSQRESDIKHKENGVLRTICAFLNSSGGLLIWGAPVGKKNADGQKVFTGDLSPVEKRYTKDEFISKISTRITPFVAPVQIQIIEMDINKYVYLIDVLESVTKPHQFEHIYYIRLDGQSKPADHYILDALFKQVKRPELEGYLRITSYRMYNNENEYFNRITLQLEVTIFNTTQTINDTDVYVQLVASPGRFETTTNPERTYEAEGAKVIILDAASLITNNLPTRKTFTYHTNTLESEEVTDNEIKFILGFGGRNSVTKINRYHIKLRSDYRALLPDWGKVVTNPKHLERILDVRREENVVTSDRWQGSEKDRMEVTLSGI
ncbi:AlbA family DNA-binding domain-containing protein [Spirosoma arcticum]